MKKVVSLVMVMALAVTMLLGCSNSGTSNSSGSTSSSESSTASSAQSSSEETSTSSSEQSEQSSEPSSNAGLRDFTCLGDDTRGDDVDMSSAYTEYYCWQELVKLMEAKNINLVPEFVQSDQYTTTLQTRFAANNDIPMFCNYALSDNEALSAADNGLLKDVMPLIDGGDGTAKAFFTENEYGVGLVNKNTIDGHLWWLTNTYILCDGYDGQAGTKYGVLPGHSVVLIRYDWLQKYGLDMPTTLDEYVTALETFYTEDPSGTGAQTAGNNVYNGDIVHLRDAMAEWFGLGRGILNILWAEDKAVFTWEQEGFDDYILFIQDLMNRGLVDPTMAQSNDELRSKIANNQVGALTDFSSERYYEPLIEASKDENGQITAQYVGITPIQALDGVQPVLPIENPILYYGHFVFTTQLTDDQLGSDFLDVLYSEPSIILYTWGVEGKNYEVVNGERQYLSTTMDIDGTETTFLLDEPGQYTKQKAQLRVLVGRQLYGNTLFPEVVYHNSRASFDNAAQIPWATRKIQAVYEILDTMDPYYTSTDPEQAMAAPTAEEAQVYNDTYSDISTVSAEFMSQLIQSQATVDDIPTMIAQLKEMGIDDLVQIYQNRHDRYIGK